MVSARTVEADPVPIDGRDWLILNALSDDYESVEQILSLVNTPTEAWPDVTPLEIIDHLERLYRAKHVFLILDKKFEREEMIREIDQTADRKFWFGRTPSGDTLWQEYTKEFCPKEWD